MKLLLCIIALFLFASLAQAQTDPNFEGTVFSEDGPSYGGHWGVQENKILAQNNPLYRTMLHLGMQNVAQQALASYGIQFSVNPEHKVYSVRSEKFPGLRVTFELDMKDVNGRDHHVNFVVGYQSWRNYYGLESFAVLN